MGMVIFSPKIKIKRKQLPVFQSKYTIGSTLWSFSTQKIKKRKQIVRFSVKTYNREYPMFIFNPEIKKNGSRLSVFQSKHTIGVPYGHFQPRKKKNGSRLSVFQSKLKVGSTLWSFSTQKLKKTE